MFVFVRPRTTRGQYTLCTSVPAAATVITCEFASSEFYRDRAFLVIYIKINAVTNFHTVRQGGQSHLSAGFQQMMQPIACHSVQLLSLPNWQV